MPTAKTRRLLVHMMVVAAEIARDLGVEDAFRVVTTNGAAAGQSVFHLHFHILAGRRFDWPPGSYRGMRAEG